jgi:hypothetical protein
MKKLIALLMVAVMAVMLAACADDVEDEIDTSATLNVDTQPEVTTVTTPTTTATENESNQPTAVSHDDTYSLGVTLTEFTERFIYEVGLFREGGVMGNYTINSEIPVWNGGAERIRWQPLKRLEGANANIFYFEFNVLPCGELSSIELNQVSDNTCDPSNLPDDCHGRFQFGICLCYSEGSANRRQFSWSLATIIVELADKTALQADVANNLGRRFEFVHDFSDVRNHIRFETIRQNQSWEEWMAGELFRQTFKIYAFKEMPDLSEQLVPEPSYTFMNDYPYIPDVTSISNNLVFSEKDDFGNGKYRYLHDLHDQNWGSYNQDMAAFRTALEVSGFNHMGNCEEATHFYNSERNMSLYYTMLPDYRGLHENDDWEIKMLFSIVISVGNSY